MGAIAFRSLSAKAIEDAIARYLAREHQDIS
jgi:hypothetical protein